MGCYGLRTRPAGAFGGHVHPQRSALYQSGAEGGRNLLAAWERFWGWILGVGFVELVLCGGTLSVCFPESRSLRAAPRGVLRWCGARGALRPLFLLRSCAADQEKRPEKKSWALMACASVQLERLGDTCILSAPRCISRWQRKKVFFCLCGKGFGDGFGGGFVELVLYGGALVVCCPEGRPRVP